MTRLMMVIIEHITQTGTNVAATKVAWQSSTCVWLSTSEIPRLMLIIVEWLAMMVGNTKDILHRLACVVYTLTFVIDWLSINDENVWFIILLVVDEIDIFCRLQPAHSVTVSLMRRGNLQRRLIRPNIFAFTHHTEKIVEIQFVADNGLIFQRICTLLVFVMFRRVVASTIGQGVQEIESWCRRMTHAKRSWCILTEIYRSVGVAVAAHADDVVKQQIIIFALITCRLLLCCYVARAIRRLMMWKISVCFFVGR